jgi:hypothetical protein
VTEFIVSSSSSTYFRCLIPHSDAAIASDNDRHSLTDGQHEFEFRFHLPASNDLATSFEGSFGSVRYLIKADLDQSWAFTHRTKKAFTVISPTDINTLNLRVCLIVPQNGYDMNCEMTLHYLSRLLL